VNVENEIKIDVNKNCVCEDINSLELKFEEKLQIEEKEEKSNVVEDDIFAKYKKLQKKFEKEEEKTRCVICFDDDRSVRYEKIISNDHYTRFHPCGHFVVCNKCSLLLKECPICRHVIAKKHKVYI